MHFILKWHTLVSLSTQSESKKKIKMKLQSNIFISHTKKVKVVNRKTRFPCESLPPVLHNIWMKQKHDSISTSFRRSLQFLNYLRERGAWRLTECGELLADNIPIVSVHFCSFMAFKAPLSEVLHVVPELLSVAVHVPNFTVWNSAISFNSPSSAYIHVCLNDALRVKRKDEVDGSHIKRGNKTK